MYPLRINPCKAPCKGLKSIFVYKIEKRGRVGFGGRQICLRDLRFIYNYTILIFPHLVAKDYQKERLEEDTRTQMMILGQRNLKLRVSSSYHIYRLFFQVRLGYLRVKECLAGVELPRRNQKCQKSYCENTKKSITSDSSLDP